MPKAHQPERVWPAVAVTLGAILVLGILVLGPWPEVLPGPASRATATAAPRPTTTAAEDPSPVKTASAMAARLAGPAPLPTPTAAPAVAPAVTPDGQLRRANVPILMYHYVGGLPADADAYRVDLTVPPDRFEAQLAYLRTAGYTGVSLEDLVRHLAAGAPLPPKPIILTFDDGYLDNYLYAFPLLRRHGFTGTFFVVTQFMDEARPGYITWEQARLMQANGMDIQAHGITHEDLRQQSADQVLQQVAGSQQAIEMHLHKPVRFFAYPFGQYDGQVIAALRAAGYWGAVTTEAGVAQSSESLFQMARLRVHGAYDLDRFVATLDYYLP